MVQQMVTKQKALFGVDMTGATNRKLVNTMLWCAMLWCIVMCSYLWMLTLLLPFVLFAIVF